MRCGLCAQVFMRVMQLSHEHPNLVRIIAPLVCELVEWWSALLADSSGELDNIASATQNMLSTWSMTVMSDSSFGAVILPAVLTALTSKNDNVSDCLCWICATISLLGCLSRWCKQPRGFCLRSRWGTRKLWPKRLTPCWKFSTKASQT